VKRLDVYYSGWGEDWPLATLAEDGNTLLFEYSAEAVAQGLELSPLHLKLRPAAYGNFPAHLLRLPGLVADALPDGWGLLLMDRWFRQQGRAPSPLDRLAFLGNRAMGALRFVPAEEPSTEVTDWPLPSLAEEAQQILAGKATEALRELVVVGGSPQGARPKALVQYDVFSNNVSTLPDAPGQPWLVKFPARGEHKEVCALEHLYAAFATLCGLEIPETAWFDLSPKLAAFGMARFDREEGMRVPVHSLAGLLHANFRLPGTDYITLLRATRLITRDQREVDKAYARAVFNVVFHNRDDHAKNFAWRLGRDRRWRLAPAFDLTCSEGPNGHHFSDVCGEGKNITRSHLLRLAGEGGIEKTVAEAVIEQVTEQAGRFRELAQNYPIRRATVQKWATTIESCRKAVVG
jgi:serine/threonine-protein kinase HipA